MRKEISMVLIIAMLLSACGTVPENTEEYGTQTESDFTESSTGATSETVDKSETEVSTENTTPSESESATENVIPSESEVPSESTSEEKESEITPAPSEPEGPKEPVYTYTDMSKTMYAKSSVNVRDLPSDEGEKIGNLAKGVAVKITGICNETSWYRIEYNNGIGYISNNYLQEEKPVIEYTYKIYEDPEDVWLYSVHKNSAKVYDAPSTSGNVIDTFGYKHAVFVTGKCKETGWYKIAYDDTYCAESNYENHWKLNYNEAKGDYWIVFPKEAKNIKEGYINPKDVLSPDDWSSTIYHNWNGIKYYESYGESAEQLAFYKKLCYADKFTIMEYEDTAMMLIPDPDAPSKLHEGWTMCDEAYEMLEEYMNERGHRRGNAGDLWLDEDASAYYIGMSFTKLEDQYCDINYDGHGGGHWINWDYVERIYGYTEDAVWTCMAYVTLDICDRSFGVWNDEEQEVRFTIEEVVKICKIMEEYRANQ